MKNSVMHKIGFLWIFGLLVFLLSRKTIYAQSIYDLNTDEICESEMDSVDCDAGKLPSGMNETYWYLHYVGETTTYPVNLRIQSPLVEIMDCPDLPIKDTGFIVESGSTIHDYSDYKYFFARTKAGIQFSTHKDIKMESVEIEDTVMNLSDGTCTFTATLTPERDLSEYETEFVWDFQKDKLSGEDIVEVVSQTDNSITIKATDWGECNVSIAVKGSTYINCVYDGAELTIIDDTPYEVGQIVDSGTYIVNKNQMYLEEEETEPPVIDWSVEYLGDDNFLLWIRGEGTYYEIPNFKWKKRLTQAIVDEKITALYNSFDEFINLSKVTLPLGLQTISGAFYDCESLIDLNIPNGVKVIDDYSFCKCKSISNIIIPGSVEYLGEYCFSKCDKLAKLTIPNSIKEGSITKYDINTFIGEVDNNREDTFDIYFEGNMSRKFLQKDPAWILASPIEMHDNIGITITDCPESLNVYETRDLSIDLHEEAGLVVDHWESSNPDVITVDDNGHIKAVSEGKASVIVVEKHGYNYESPEIEVLKGNLIPLPAPTGLTWKGTEKTIASWNAVNHAKGYKLQVEIVGDTKPHSVSLDTDKSFIDLKDTITSLFSTVSDPSVITSVRFRVLASSDETDQFVNSDWSEYSKDSGYRVKAVDPDHSSTNIPGNDTDISIPSTTETDIYLVKGMSYTLPSDISWFTSNSSYATVKQSTLKTIKATDKNALTVYDVNKSHVYNVHIVDPYLTVSGSKASSLTLAAGDNTVFEISGLSGYGDSYQVLWESLNTEIASVSSSGVVTAHSKGSTKINAYIGGKKLICTVKVTDTQPIPKTINNNATIKLSPLQQTTLKFANSAFKAKNLKWESSEDNLTKAGIYYQNDVVRAFNNGKIIAVGVGETTLQATDQNGNTMSFTVVVNAPAEQNIYINLNKAKTVKFYNVKGNTANWVTGDATIIGTGYSGKIKGYKVGQTTLTCFYDPYNTGNPLEYKANITVENPLIVVDDYSKWSKVNAKRTSGTLTLNKGTEYALKLDNIYHDVSFTSNKNSIVFADENGTVKARRPGKAKLTAKVNGTTITVNVVVK